MVQPTPTSITPSPSVSPSVSPSISPEQVEIVQRVHGAALELRNSIEALNQLHTLVRFVQAMSTSMLEDDDEGEEEKEGEPERE